MENDKIEEKIATKIESIIEEGVDMSNLDMLGKLVDIHKDLSNEDYWNIKKEVMENELQKSRRLWKL